MFTKALKSAGALIASAMVFMALSVAPAAADKSSEDYVAKNAQAALNALSVTGGQDARAAQFGALMDKFADLPRIAEFVLGRHARALRADQALYKEWQTTFRDYAVAVYQDQLDIYRGRTVKVLPGSTDSKINGRTYSIVRTEISQPNGAPFLVNWRLLKANDGTWKVVDAAVKLEDNVIWLAIQQQQEFLAKLDKNGGDVRQLIADVKAQTAQMRARINAKQG